MRPRNSPSKNNGRITEEKRRARRLVKYTNFDSNLLQKLKLLQYHVHKQVIDYQKDLYCQLKTESEIYTTTNG